MNVSMKFTLVADSELDGHAHVLYKSMRKVTSSETTLVMSRALQKDETGIKYGPCCEVISHSSLMSTTT